jgi:Leucine Rich repeat
MKLAVPELQLPAHLVNLPVRSHEEKKPEQQTAVAVIGEGVRSLPAVDFEARGYRRAVLTALNLHSNRISSFLGLEAFTSLTSLNLSGNELDGAAIEASAPHLSALTALVTLDLSANRITSLRGLPCLSQLRRLLLPYNAIASLDGLQALAPALQHLDLRANKLTAPLEQHCRVLRTLTRLQELTLQSSSGSQTNPVCSAANYNAATLAAAGIAALQQLDGADVTGIVRDAIAAAAGQAIVAMPKFDAVAARFKKVQALCFCSFSAHTCKLLKCSSLCVCYRSLSAGSRRTVHRHSSTAASSSDSATAAKLLLHLSATTARKTATQRALMMTLMTMMQ